MKKLWMLVFCLLTIVAAAKTPVQPTAAAAKQFTQIAKTIFPLVYEYLTAELVAALNLSERPGIGIDIGGGPGDWVIRLAQAAPGIYWINTDINPHYGGYFMQTALDSTVTSRVGWVPADAAALPFRDNYADVIISRGSFQFWPDLAAGIAEIRRVLKPGGKILLIVPNYLSLKEIFFEDYKHGWVTTRKRIKDMLLDCHYEILGFRYTIGWVTMRMNPLTAFLRFGFSILFAVLRLNIVERSMEFFKLDIILGNKIKKTFFELIVIEAKVGNKKEIDE